MSLTPEELEVLTSSGLQESRIDVIKEMLEERVAQREKDWTTCPEPQQGPTRNLNILLSGLGGVGKSSLGNLLLNSPDGSKFTTSNKAASETTNIQEAKGEYNGAKVTVYDTPGYLLRPLIKKSKGKAAEVDPLVAIQKELGLIGGVDVIVFVLNGSDARNRNEEVKLIRKLLLVNDKMLGHCMMVVTHSATNYGGKTVEDFMKDGESSPEFKNLMEKIKNRVVLVEVGDDDLLNEKKVKGGTAVFDKEKRIARETVFKMAAKVRVQCGPMIYGGELHMVVKNLDCFYGQSIVSTPLGKKTMEELELNDEVLVVNSQGQLLYEKVIMFGHANPSHKAYFCTLSTEDGKALQLSPGHLLHVGHIGNLTAAQDVKVGDVVFTVEAVEGGSVKPALVTTITLEWLTGIYCPHTACGSIIVDGVVASCYTNHLSPTLAHAAMLPVRVAHRLLPDDWFRWMLPYNQEQGMPSLVLKLDRMLRWL